MVKQGQKQKERRRKCEKEGNSTAWGEASEKMRGKCLHPSAHSDCFTINITIWIGTTIKQSKQYEGKRGQKQKERDKKDSPEGTAAKLRCQREWIPKKSSHPNLRHFLAPKKGMARVMHFIDEKICKYLDNYKHLLKTMTSTSSGYKIIH